MGRALEQVCSHRILLILGFVPASIFFMAFFAPIFNAFGFNIGESIYNLLSHICHQHFERVFFVFGHPTALCSRCIGGYLGVFSALIALIFYQKENKEAYISLYAIGSTILLLAIIDGLVKFGHSVEFRFFSGALGGLGFGLMGASIYHYIKGVFYAY